MRSLANFDVNRQGFAAPNHGEGQHITRLDGFNRGHDIRRTGYVGPANGSDYIALSQYVYRWAIVQNMAYDGSAGDP